MSVRTSAQRRGPRAGSTGPVALVVVTRNRVEQLLRTLPRHLSLPERPRVVLVDDASSDGTAEVVAERFPEVEVRRLASSRGAVARNVGLAEASEPFVAFCDDDAWFDPGSLRQAVALLERHPRLAVVNPRVLVGAQRRLDPVCAEMQASPLAPAPAQPGHALLSFVACALVVRRSALLEVGGFCERMGTGGEERLIGWDLAGAGWQMSYVPQITAHHWPPPNDGRRARRVSAVRNELWAQWLRRPAREALRASLRELRRDPGVAPDALLRALAGAPWVLRSRRVNPPHVEQMIARLEA